MLGPLEKSIKILLAYFLLYSIIFIVSTGIKHETTTIN